MFIKIVLSHDLNIFVIFKFFEFDIIYLLIHDILLL